MNCRFQNPHRTTPHPTALLPLNLFRTRIHLYLLVSVLCAGFAMADDNIVGSLYSSMTAAAAVVSTDTNDEYVSESHAVFVVAHLCFSLPSTYA